ncbi:MAG: sugar phosphate isomerase/epimerase [Candidatus Aminicenantes bacterium]|nr:sugar phosphate isomerase/epimerase [Candidatus Aminicenantes bacterium]
MFNSFYIRVASDRMSREAPLLLKMKANPEVYISAENLLRFTPQRIREVAGELSAFPSHTIHAPFMDVWPGAADEAIRRLSLEQMQKIMSLAAAWKSLLVVMHFNYDPIYYRQHFERWLDRAARFYQTLLAESDGPFIALENIAEPTPYVALQLMKRADRPRLVHCFDFGHHHVFGRIPAEEWLFYLAPHRHIHFHLHDNFGANDDHLPLGQGNIDWPAARAAISGVGCPFSIALEPHSAPALRTTAENFKRIFA